MDPTSQGPSVGTAREGPSPKYQAHLREALEHASRDLDRAILTISGGSLALSLAFLRDLNASPDQPWLLQTAWFLLGLSLTSMLGSIVVSTYNIRTRIRQQAAGRPEVTRLRWLTRRLTDLSWVGALGGISFLVGFAAANI